jgi:hypothetical protein
MGASLPENTIANLDAIADILFRCFIATVGAMLFTWAVSLVFGDLILVVFNHTAEINRKELDLFLLHVMAILKGLNALFSLFPFIAIKWYLRGQH